MSLTCHSNPTSLSSFSRSTHEQHDKPKPWDHEGIDHWTIPKFEKVKSYEKKGKGGGEKERDIRSSRQTTKGKNVNLNLSTSKKKKLEIKIKNRRTTPTASSRSRLSPCCSPSTASATSATRGRRSQRL